MSTINTTLIDTDTTDGVTRNWYEISGTDYGTSWEFDGTETFALTSTDRVLDSEGYPLTEGDNKTIAVRNAIANA